VLKAAACVEFTGELVNEEIDYNRTEEPAILFVKSIHRGFFRKTKE